MKSALLSDLARGSLVELVPGLEDAFIEHGLVHHFAAGAEIARQGDEIEHLLIPLDAGLQLFDGKTGVSLGFLAAKRSLGLREAIDRRPYRYSARTEEATTAALLPAEELRKLLGADPRLEHYLRLATRSAGIRAFRRYLDDQGVAWPEVLEILSKVELESTILSRGEAVSTNSPGLHFVSAGEIEIHGRHSRSLVIGEGAWFGGETLVPPHRSSYRAEARTTTRLHRAPMAPLKGLLDRLGLLDALHDEPCLGDLNGPARAETKEAERLPIEAQSIEGSERTLDPRRITRAQSPEGAFAATIKNAALVLGLPTNPARIESGLQLEANPTLLSLAKQLEVFGAIASPQAVTHAELDLVRYPALALFGDRPVLLLGQKGTRFSVLDAVQGPGLMESEALLQHSGGVLLEVMAGPGSAPSPPTDLGSTQEPHPSRAAVKALLLRDRSLLIGFAGLTVLGLGLGLLSPVFLRYLLDEILLLGTVDLLAGLMIGLGLTTLVSSLVSMGRSYVLAELTMRFDADLSRVFYRHALSLPLAFYDRVKVGDVLARLVEITRIRDFFSQRSVESVVDLLSVFVYAAALLAFSPMIGLTAIGLVVVLVAIQLVMRKALRRLYERAFEASRRNRSLVAEMFGAITAVKASSAESVLRARFEETVITGLDARARLGMRVASTQALMNLMSSAGTAGVLWFVCAAALEGRMSIGSILAASIYLQSILGPVRRLSELLAETEEVRVATRKLDDVLKTPLEEDPARAMLTHAVRLRGKIRLDNVGFRYRPESPWVLENINLTIYPGQTIAIVGRSGSGKSTLVNLLSGLVRPTQGRLYYDDHDATMVALGALREQIGFVRQDFQLFSGSIADNIAYGDDQPDQERIDRAARLAFASEFIENFPLGYRHFLPPGGIGLSGGQKQRIAIARVIYDDPRILILDEALSALDAESESAINGNMADITAGRTTIVVAHRLSTVKNADRVIVIDEGRIVEEGQHHSLIERGGLYRELFEGQIVEGDAVA